MNVIGPGLIGENGLKFQSESKHIIENVKRILLTRRGERVGDLSFGSDLRKYLFMPEISISDVITEIKNSVERCDPRIEIVECEFVSFDNLTEELIINLVIRKKADGTTVSTSLSV